MKQKIERVVILFLFLFFISFKLQSTPFKDFERKFDRAKTLYNSGNYSAALKLYLELYKSDSSNCNICYKIGSCYLKSGRENRKTLYFLKKAAFSVSSNYNDDSVKERNAPVIVYRLLGDAYHLNYEFDAAIEMFQKFLKTEANDKEISREMTRKIAMCNIGKELVAEPLEVKITNLGKNINSPYPDYAPKLSADQSTMIFTSKRPGNTGGNTYDGGQYFEDIYISVKKNNQWQKAENLGWPVNTVGNESAIAMSVDGQEILIYKDDLGDGNIYSSELNGDKWSMPKKLNSHINSKWWEPAACISADGNTLFFVSDRPGGYGGSDIYKSSKTSRGEWGRAVNLGPTINTPYDEHTPFIHPDGATLYFSSKGHKSMGGFDVFYSRTLMSDNRTWLEPTNVGYPINTTGDDAFYILSPDKSVAYYTSSSENGFGEKDNYMIVFPNMNESAPLSLIKGEVLDTNNNAAKNVEITVSDNQTGEVIAVYHTNNKTGKYSFILPGGKSHNITYDAEGHMFCSASEYADGNKYKETEEQVKLTPLKVGASTRLNNVFFNYDDSNLRPSSKVELERMFEFMMKYPKIKVEIIGYADSRGSDAYNKKLSLDRATAVVNYLVKKGIEKQRLVATGLGESKSHQDKSGQTGSNGLKPSDRRVEFKIIEM